MEPQPTRTGLDVQGSGPDVSVGTIDTAELLYTTTPPCVDHKRRMELQGASCQQTEDNLSRLLRIRALEIHRSYLLTYLNHSSRTLKVFLHFITVNISILTHIPTWNVRQNGDVHGYEVEKHL